MRELHLDLSVLQSPLEAFNPWPGSEQAVEFSDATCPSVGGDSPEFIPELGFVVLGFDASASDSLPAPSGWQFFTPGEAGPLIPGWEAADLEWHAATRITCSNNPDNFWLVSNSFYDVQALFTICCGAANFPTQPLAMKLSPSPLVAGVAYPCTVEAVFKNIAIKGNNDATTTTSSFRYTLEAADHDPSKTLIFDVDTNLPLTTVNQRTMRWPIDFFGLVSNTGVTLVANDAPLIPGVSVQVRTFDGGTIKSRTRITVPLMSIVTDEHTWALPFTDCAPPCGILNWSFFDEPGDGVVEFILVLNGLNVFSTRVNGSGQLTLGPGDNVNVMLVSDVPAPTAELALTVASPTFNFSGTNNAFLNTTWTVTCGETVQANGRQNAITP